MSSILGFQAPLLRSVADECHLPSVSQIARAPGMQDVYRITIHLFDRRASDSVSTLRCSTTDGAVLETVYQRTPLLKPIKHVMDAAEYDAFVKAVASVSFDRLPDQPRLPDYDATDLWLVERAAGTFLHSVIVAPDLAQNQYARLVNAVKHGLPAVLRQVK